MINNNNNIINNNDNNNNNNTLLYTWDGSGAVVYGPYLYYNRWLTIILLIIMITLYRTPGTGVELSYMDPTFIITGD